MAQKKLRRKKVKPFPWRYVLAGIFLIIGIVLLLVNPIKNYIIKQGSQTHAIRTLTRDDIEANLSKKVTYNFDDVKSINPLSVIKNHLTPEDLPTVGAIDIPSLKANLPIFLGVSDEGMYLGAGTLVEGQQKWANLITH